MLRTLFLGPLLVACLAYPLSAHALEPINVLLARNSTTVSVSAVRDALVQANLVMIGTGLSTRVFESASFDAADMPEVFLANCPSSSDTPSEVLTTCASEQLSDLRDAHSADVVLMVVENMELCGGVPPEMLGEGNVPVSASNENLAYAVVKQSCITNPSNNMQAAAHELGHLLSLEHHSGDPNPEIPVSYNHAAVDSLLGLLGNLTAEATPGDIGPLCQLGLSCQYHAFFSADGKTFPNGEPAGEASSSNSKRVIEELAWDVVACYRGCELLLIGADVEDSYDPIEDESLFDHPVFIGGIDPACVWTKPESGMWDNVLSGGAIFMCGQDGQWANYSYFFVEDDVFQFGEQAFTIEFFAHTYGRTQTPNPLITNESALGNEGYWALLYRDEYPEDAVIELRAGSTVVASTNVWPAWPDVDWVHVALVRAGDRGTVFLNGTPVIDEESIFHNITFSLPADRKLSFGGWSSGAIPQWGNYHGHLDEIRISSGPRYVMPFTPPVPPFPRPMAPTP